MYKLLKENRAYYISYFILFAIGLVVYFNIEKGDEIIFFAKDRNADLDLAFSYITKIGEAYIYIIAIVMLVYTAYRYALIVPLIGLCTLIFSFLFKSIFATPRPRTYLYKLFDSGELSVIPDLSMHIGYNSFPSGHSMSGFAIFTFIALSLRNKFFSFLMIIPASLVAFSRVVISQHFLEDILAGSLCGLLLATLIFLLQSRVPINELTWYDRKFSNKHLGTMFRRRNKPSNDEY